MQTNSVMAAVHLTQKTTCQKRAWYSNQSTVSASVLSEQRRNYSIHTVYVCVCVSGCREENGITEHTVHVIWLNAASFIHSSLFIFVFFKLKIIKSRIESRHTQLRLMTTFKYELRRECKCFACIFSWSQRGYVKQTQFLYFLWRVLIY